MNKIEIWPIVGSLFLGMLTAGCDRPRPTAGGTPGIIHCGGAVLDSIQVKLYRQVGEHYREIGSGVSGADGRFQLVTDDASRPLWLEPGEYRITWESIGSVPLIWPAEFHDPATSPLGCIWSEADETLDIDAPEPQRID